MSERTQECYTRSVRQLVDFYEKTPDQINELELEDYFLHRRNIDKWAAATLRIAYSGIRFFFVNVLKREWHIFTYLNAKRERRLPYILSKEEVFRILDHVTTFHNYTFLSTVYACGLRISEALALQVSDIDSQRMMIHVHRGKGAKDRYVPLPQDTLCLLRQYWLTHKNPILVFLALGRGSNEGPTAKIPWQSKASMGAFRRAKFAAGIIKVSTLCDIATLPIFWKLVLTPELSSYIWDTAGLRLQWSIFTSPRKGAKTSIRSSILTGGTEQ